MTSLDVLYYSLAAGIIIFVGAIWYMVYSVVTTLETAKPILKDIKQMTQDIEELKNTVKTIFPLGILGRIIQKLFISFSAK